MMVLIGGLIVGLLAGCDHGGGGSVAGPSGGGSSTTAAQGKSVPSGGGDSTAAVQGHLVRGGRSASRGPIYLAMLDLALGIRTAEALAGDPVVGATVILTPSGGGTPLQTKTDSTGHFEFDDLLPGTYTLSVKVDPVTPPFLVTLPPLDATSNGSIIVGAGDLGVIEGTVTESALVVSDVHVAAQSETADGILQNAAQKGHAMNIAAAAGVPLEQVINYRLAGHGWGATAHHFGVSPGNIGLGGSGNAGGNGKGKNKS